MVEEGEDDEEGGREWISTVVATAPALLVPKKHHRCELNQQTLLYAFRENPQGCE